MLISGMAGIWGSSRVGLRIKSGKQKVVEDKGNGNKLFSYRYISIIYTIKRRKNNLVTFIFTSVSFSFALPKIICSLFFILSFFLWPLICTDDSIKIDLIVVSINNFLGQSSILYNIAKVHKKVGFSYKRGCKCVNISLKVQKNCKSVSHQEV